MKFARDKLWVNSERCVCETEGDTITFKEDVTAEELKYIISALLEAREAKRQEALKAKWFMSYMVVTSDTVSDGAGSFKDIIRIKHGSTILEEHPLSAVARWNKRYKEEYEYRRKTRNASMLMREEAHILWWKSLDPHEPKEEIDYETVTKRE